MNGPLQSTPNSSFTVLTSIFHLRCYPLLRYQYPCCFDLKSEASDLLTVHISQMKLKAKSIIVLAFAIIHVTNSFVVQRNNAVFRTTLSSSRMRKIDSSLPASTEESAELLSLLLQKHRYKISPLEAERIEELIESLTSQNIPFDPDISLNGPLFAVLYQMGPQPFWEAYDFDLSSFTGIRNIKGQKYVKAGDGLIGVTNYAEFWGKQFNVQAIGVAKKNDDNESTSESDDASSVDADLEVPKPKRSGLFGGIFRKQNKNQEPGEGKNKSNLLTCPVDYTIQVKSAYVNILDNKFDIDINGTGYLRVLYADENMRILTSPKATTDAKIGEKEGLTVAQVRIDLLDESIEGASKGE